MSHITKYNSNFQIIETKFENEIDVSEILEVMQFNAELAIQYNCYLWLNDYSKAISKVNCYDTLKFPEKMINLQNEFGLNVFKIKRAIIKNNFSTTFDFAQIVNENRGQNVKVFTNFDNAITWLKGS